MNANITFLIHHGPGVDVFEDYGFSAYVTVQCGGRFVAHLGPFDDAETATLAALRMAKHVR